VLKRIFLFLITVSCLAQNSSYQDLKETVGYLIDGTYTQFKTKTNLYYLAPALGTTYYAFEEDKRLSDHQRSKKLRKIYDITGDFGIVFNFPIVPVSLYYIGKAKKNTKLIQFAKEYMAAMYLTLAETGIISFIPGHERPNLEGQSKWETALRGDNSFPSGHIVPYSVLFFKTFQFYGPYWSVIPATLTYFASMQRIREGRHYVSDILGSFWLAAFASEGVRNVVKYDNNDKRYKSIFESAQLSFSHHQGVIGPGITFRF
jgi:membrane-associated phospholipid phosphatase